MKGPLLQMVQPILQIIAANKGISMNEYLMRSASIFHHFIPFHSIHRTVARIFAFLKQQALTILHLSAHGAQGAETGLSMRAS